jgi:hypothetical protein
LGDAPDGGKVGLAVDARCSERLAAFAASQEPAMGKVPDGQTAAHSVDAGALHVCQYSLQLDSDTRDS